MIFELSREELMQTFGKERVHQTASGMAEAAGFSGDALNFLTTVGLPDNEFVSFPRLDVGGPGFRPVPVEEIGGTWNLPAAANHWVSSATSRSAPSWQTREQVSCTNWPKASCAPSRCTGTFPLWCTP